MSLNITVLSETLIYQSGDFRLVDRHGQRVNFEAQKQIQVTRFRWSAVVGFVGIGSVRNLIVSEWLAEKTAELPQDANFGALIEILSSADEWIQRAPLQRRLHTFSVGAFVGHRPLFAVVSNFEAVHERPSRLPRPRLRTSYLRPRRERVFVTGRPATVTKLERQSLIGHVRAKATPQVMMNALAEVNASAHGRDADYISEDCFTSYVRLTGEGGGMVHGLDGRPYIPKFMIPSSVEDAIKKLLRDQFPQGAQLRSFSSMRSPGSEADHLVQLREKPNDPSVHNNYGAFLQDTKTDSVGAEAAFTRAIELDPNHSLALGNLANRLWDRGEVDRAEELHRRAFASNPQSEIARAKLAWFLLRARDDVETAIRLCEEGLRPEETNAELLEVYCEALMRGGKHEAAAQHYGRLYELRPSSAGVAFGYGAALQASGGSPALIEPLYRQVLEQEPESGVAMLNLAQLRYESGAVEEAGSLVRRAVALIAEPGVKVEALFCWYAFEANPDVLDELKVLLLAGARSPGWDLTPVVERSAALGHPEAEFLRLLGDVITGVKSPNDLDGFPIWRALRGS